MAALVLQLQSDALDRDVPVSDLLRKTLVAARKLKQPEMEGWVQKELDGYTDHADVPDYRKISGRIEALNPYHGWQPIMWEDTELAEETSQRLSFQSVSELDSLLSNSEHKNKQFMMTLPAPIEKQICDAIGHQTQVTFMTTGTEFQKILDSVRNVVVKWALQLEEDGILGENLRFSEKEKATAEQGSYHIQNYFAGDIQGSQIQQQSPNATQIGKFGDIDVDAIGTFIQSLQGCLDQLNLSEPDKDQVVAEIKTVDAQIQSPEPKPVIIKESLSTLRRILEGAGGAVAAELLVLLAKILGAG